MVGLVPERPWWGSVPERPWWGSVPERPWWVQYLSVHGGSPVAVVEDDCVGARQVDPNAPRACREDEDKDARVDIEALHEGLTLLYARCTVQPTVPAARVA